MTIQEYLESIKERLLTDSAIAVFHILRERITSTDGHLRAKLEMANETFLEFSEYVQIGDEEEIEVKTYSYHWSDAKDQLIKRWDNTPHFPDLPNFPHHVHVGVEDKVESGKQMSIFTVLDEIASYGK